MVVTTTHYLASSMYHPPKEIPDESLLDGTFLPRMALTKDVWVSIPDNIFWIFDWRIQELFQLRAVVVTFLPLIAVYYYFRIKKQLKLAYVGLLSLCVGIIPYAIGMVMLALAQNRGDPNLVAPANITMLLGLMYVSLVCAILTGVSLYKQE